MKEPISKRYYAKAADFYRAKLKELCDKGVSKDGSRGGIDFLQIQEKPSYEEGRIISTFNQPRFSVDS
jgi:hypothetical protein